MNAREHEELRKAIDKGVREGVAAALRRHKAAGNPIHIWRDGKVVEIPPEEIPVEPEDPANPDQLPGRWW